MPSPAEWALIVPASGAVGAAFLRIYQAVTGRDVTRATAEKLRAEAKETAQDAASKEVAMLQTIIGEVSEQRTADRLDYERQRTELSEQIKSLVGRVSRLEERERHMLTRAAVHEAWDQLAFNAIVNHDRKFPPPPPLAIEPDPDAPN